MARPRHTREHAVTVLRPSAGMVPEVCAPDVRNRTFTITATVDVDADGGAARGVIASQGSGLSGWVLHTDGQDVIWHLNVATSRRTTVRGAAPLGAGRHVVELRYTKTAELQGNALLVVDGREVARGDVTFTHATRISLTGAGLSIGRADAYPVSDDPSAAEPFTATIDTVVFALDGTPHVDDDDVEVAIAVQ
jgi:arylsulfatase